LVVDDGSTDRTAALAEAVGDGRVRVIRHPRNYGVGAAIGSGYRAALEVESDAVAVMAGDAQMHPEDLPVLLWPVVGGEADYAKGDRLSHGEAWARMPVLRFLGNHLLSWLTRICTGTRLRDSQCGYTAISRKALERIPLHALWKGYGYPNDLLGWLGLTGASVRDVTVRPVYGMERSGVGLRHALFVVPFVLLRVLARRLVAARRDRSARARLAPSFSTEPE
jgi:glycosyltransferase involved in cell wall biosynthesis